MDRLLVPGGRAATSGAACSAECRHAGTTYHSSWCFSETDFTDDLKQIDVPVLVLHGDDDQFGPLSAKLVKHGTLKVYKGFPHGAFTIHADIINPDLLAFIRG